MTVPYDGLTSIGLGLVTGLTIGRGSGLGLCGLITGREGLLSGLTSGLGAGFWGRISGLAAGREGLACGFLLEGLSCLDADGLDSVLLYWASESIVNAVNANPISIAAIVLADSLIIHDFRVNRYGTSAIVRGIRPHLCANNP